MDSASFRFVCFGFIVAVVVNLRTSAQWRRATLLLGSIVFLALINRDPASYAPLAGFLLLGYLALWLLQRGYVAIKPWSIVAVILAYLWLKKYTFLPADSFLRYPYVTLGLSYIFFRVLHMIIESGSGQQTAPTRLDSYLLYNLNFTTFVSGPIQRYDEAMRQQAAPESIPLNAQIIGLQLERIIRGFFKVNVLAMLLNSVHDDALSQLSPLYPLNVRLLAAFRLAIAYPLFLYCNFSGYIDIVIALGRLMRLNLPENFDRPFAACSVLEFWTRWHMTLSNWLKTYVYNPLLVALMRRNTSQRLEPYLGVPCFFVTFFLIGIWHGRTSEFVVFGFLTGAGMSLNQLWQIWLKMKLGRKDYKTLAARSAYAAPSRGLSITWFAFTLFWFWADWQQIGHIAGALNWTQWLAVWLAVWLALTVATATWEWLRAKLLEIRTENGPLLSSRYALVVYATTLGLLGFVFTAVLNQPTPAIVYKAF